MSDRDSRSGILAAIESGAISAEEGIARLAGLDSDRNVEVELEPSEPELEIDLDHEGEVSLIVEPAPPAAAPPSVVPPAVAAPPAAPAAPSISRAAAGKPGARWLRLRVRDRESGVERVKFNLPLSLVDAGLSMFSRLDPEGDWPRWRERFESGEGFTLLEVDEPGGERVEITVD